MTAFICTAVKSNVLAELMNRASKIHWKNLSLTLNGRNSETKNDKNNPKVPFFQYVQLLRNISFLLKWSFLAKICCCCQMCYFPKLSIFFKMCVVCKMFGLGHNVRFFQNGFCQNVCFWSKSDVFVKISVLVKMYVFCLGYVEMYSSVNMRVSVKMYISSSKCTIFGENVWFWSNLHFLEKYVFL